MQMFSPSLCRGLTLAAALTLAGAPADAFREPAKGLAPAAGPVGQLAEAGQIRIRDAFARATPGRVRNGAAYLTIDNAGGPADRLIGARAPLSDRVELHTHSMADGVMRMRPIEAIEIPADGAAVLEPGGDHVMIMGLAGPLVEGDRFPLTLVFERAGEIGVTVTVAAPGAMSAPGGRHGHSGHGGGSGKLD